MRVAAIVVAAGAGERFGDRKQFAELGDATAAARAVEAARSVAETVVLVVPRGETAAHGADHVVEGGATRAASVRAGLAALDPATEVVVVHDAARPLASPALFKAVVGALDPAHGVVGAIPGVPVPDTLKRVDANHAVVETVERGDVVAVQTPQAFVADALRGAHEAGDDATDDAALVEAAGGTVVIVEGEPANRKLTTREDLEALRAWLRR